MTTVREDESGLTLNNSDSTLVSPQDQQYSHGNIQRTAARPFNDELAEILDGHEEIQQSKPLSQPQQAAPAPLINKLLNSKSIVLARKLGYCLFLISIIDFVFILIPPEFLNPVWEYKVIGDIIKLVPLPIFSLLLIFVGERSNRKPIEKLPLKILSWMTLGIAIFFFLLLPLIITDYVRIDRFNNSQITAEINLQKRKLNATQEQLSRMNAQQIQDLIPRRGEDGSLGAIPESPEQAKESIVNNLERAKSQADERAALARNNVTVNLIKNSVKLFLQALMSAILYLFIWTGTKWARQTKSKRKVRRQA